MDLTISSVTTMCLLNSILILILCLFFKIDYILKKIGPRCIIVIFLFIIIRMFIPLEFPYTYSVRIEDILTPFRRLFTFSIITSPIEIMVWHVLIAIWLVGIAVCLVRKAAKYRTCLRTIALLQEEQWGDICKDYNFELEDFEELKNIRLVYCQHFDSPYLVGLGNPYLILPYKRYSNEEFHYIVLHELMHVRNKDIIWKGLIDLLCVAFWWNPVIYLLKKELSKLIEMRNDMQILSILSEEEKVSYMKCLKSTALDLAGKDMAFGVSFNRSDLKELDKRMKLIVNDNKFSRWLQVILCVIVCFLLIGTSAIIIEPYSYDADEGIAVTAENTYLVINGDEYDVYINGEYFFSTNDISSFLDVKIYNSLEEANKNEKND